MANNYALFAGSNYYPCGGWSDLQGVYASLEEAQTAFESGRPSAEPDYDFRFEWGQIVDLTTQKVLMWIDIEWSKLDSDDVFRIKTHEKHIVRELAGRDDLASLRRAFARAAAVMGGEK